MPTKNPQQPKTGATPSPQRDAPPKANPANPAATTTARPKEAKTRATDLSPTAAGSNGQPRVEPAADLDALAERVRAEHEAGLAATRKAVEHYIAAGLLLIEVRRECERLGVRFTKWLKMGKAGVSKARAYHYISLAELCLVTRQLTSEQLEDHWRQISNGTPEDTGGAQGNADTSNGEATGSGAGGGGEKNQPAEADEGGAIGSTHANGTETKKVKKRKEAEEADDPENAPKPYYLSVEAEEIEAFASLLNRVAQHFRIPVAVANDEHFGPTVRAALNQCDPGTSGGEGVGDD